MHFSGGKDSTAMLYFLRDLLNRVDVMFCDTGKILPEVLDHVYRTCETLKARLIVVHPEEDIDAYHTRIGFPVDLVPVEMTAEARDLMHVQVKQPLQSYLTCCYNMIMKPLDDNSRALGYNVILRGSKQSDARVGVSDGFIHDGVTYFSPLWDWTHEEVFEFLRENKVSLPLHYKFFSDSLDCYHCTGHMHHYGAQRIAFVRKYHPDKWPILEDRLRIVSAILDHENDLVHFAMMDGMRDG